MCIQNEAGTGGAGPQYSGTCVSQFSTLRFLLDHINAISSAGQIPIIVVQQPFISSHRNRGFEPVSGGKATADQKAVPQNPAQCCCQRQMKTKQEFQLSKLWAHARLIVYLTALLTLSAASETAFLMEAPRLHMQITGQAELKLPCKQ
jgi:hypothetical protein